MADPRIRAIKIKTGVVKRIAKEKTLYEREAEQQRARVDRLKSAGEEEHTVRKQEEVLHESLMMVPDCQRRLVKAFEELQSVLDSEAELKDTEEYKLAKVVLDEARIQLPA